MKSQNKIIIVTSSVSIISIVSILASLFFSLPAEAREIITTKQIVMIAPDFTYSAYGGDDKKFSFYYYYEGWCIPASCLTVDVEYDKQSRKFLYKDVAWNLGLTPINTYVWSDVDLHKGEACYQEPIVFGMLTKNCIVITDISKNTIMILGHQEYVTNKEYQFIKQFVYKGGTLILLDGNTFYAEIDYNEDTNKITLLKGHDYNGVKEAFDNSWAGYYYCGQGYNKSLMTYEADCVKDTSEVSIIKDWGDEVYTYMKEYGQGKVYHMGIYSDKHLDEEETIFILRGIIRTT